MRVRPVTCPKCGGRTAIHHGQQEAACRHCGQPVKLSQAVMEEQAKAWAFPPATPLRPGMKAQFRNTEYEVWGRQVLRQTDDEGTVYQWEEFVLVSPDGDVLYLEFDEGKWKVSEPYVPQAPADGERLAQASEGGFITVDHHSCLVTDSGVYQVAYVEGEFPWLASVGQSKRFVDATAKDGFYSIEWSADAIEYYRGYQLDERQIFAMFGLRHLLQALDQRMRKVRGQRAFAVICLALGLVSLVVWGMALGGAGSKVVPGGTGTVPIQQALPGLGPAQSAQAAEEGRRFGPIRLTAVDRVHRLEIRGHMREQSNWVQAVLEDEDEVELFETQRDMWDESGYDSDGAWHESDLSASTDFVLKKPGNYYLRIYTEPDPANRTPGSASASFTIRQEVIYPLYPALFGFGALILGFIWLCVASSSASAHVWTQTQAKPQAPAGGTA